MEEKQKKNHHTMNLSQKPITDDIAATTDEDEIIGYADPWIVSPGDLVNVKVSSTDAEYRWSLIRLINGLLPLPEAPPLRSEIIIPESSKTQQHGSFKLAAPGSYAVVDSWPSEGNNTVMEAGGRLSGVRLEFFVQPWMTECRHLQTLVSTLDVDSLAGFALFLDTSGQLCCLVGDGSTVQRQNTGIHLRRWRWSRISCTIKGRQVRLQVVPVSRLVEPAPASSVFENCATNEVKFAGNVPLTLAAGFFGFEQQATLKPDSCFSGKLDSFTLETQHSTAGDFSLWAQYDFAKDINSDRVVDTSGANRHGQLKNAPTRAVKGHDWDGSEPDWTKAKYGYGAIHFHDDDLDDADWPTDFTVTVPDDAVSGAYGVAVKGTSSGTEDIITFFVTPKHDRVTTRRGAPVAFVMPTFTYLAYANERMYDQDRASRLELAGGVSMRKDKHFARMNRRSDLGISMYDVHNDGSGGVFSSAKRPILNMRPDYINWAFHRPREFPADLLMLGFLEKHLGKGGYDVLTEHDLHLRGFSAVQHYNVLITGSHPEYPSLTELDVYAEYLRTGGSVMYLGGNGFYWCSETHPERPHRMEVRKGDQGCRSITLPAGERIHQINGAHGGLWRSRGRAAQVMFGVGSDACGSGPGVPYRVYQHVLQQKEFSWLWRDLQPDSSGNLLVGSEGFGGGASGDEIDRLDYDLGTPSNAVLLATANGHDDSFALFNEEAMFPMINTTASVCDKVRSDMVYYETSAGGAVFSVGSINWYCSLGWKAYDNDVAVLTRNVLDEFMRRGASKGEPKL